MEDRAHYKQRIENQRPPYGLELEVNEETTARALIAINNLGCIIAELLLDIRDEVRDDIHLVSPSIPNIDHVCDEKCDHNKK